MGARAQEKAGDSILVVSATMLLKTNGAKMSLFGLATMLMKTQEMHLSCHDIYDDNGT